MVCSPLQTRLAFSQTFGQTSPGKASGVAASAGCCHQSPRGDHSSPHLVAQLRPSPLPFSPARVCPCDRRPSGLLVSTVLPPYWDHIYRMSISNAVSLVISNRAVGVSESLGRGLGWKGMKVSKSSLELLFRAKKGTLTPSNSNLHTSSSDLLPRSRRTSVY